MVIEIADELEGLRCFHDVIKRKNVETHKSSNPMINETIDFRYVSDYAHVYSP